MLPVRCLCTESRVYLCVSDFYGEEVGCLRGDTEGSEGGCYLDEEVSGVGTRGSVLGLRGVNCGFEGEDIVVPTSRQNREDMNGEKIPTLLLALNANTISACTFRVRRRPARMSFRAL